MSITKYISSLLQVVCLATRVLFVGTIIIACEDESWERPADMSSYIPNYAVGTTGSIYVSGNIAGFNLEPHAYADFDYWQLKIISIDYYIDNELVQTDIKEPFSFIYTAVGLEQGKHKFIMKVKIKDLVNGKEICISPSKEFEVTSAGSQGYSSGLEIKGSRSSSGKNVTFTISSVDIIESLYDAGWSIKSVSYCLDEELIETLTEKPFAFKYTAKDLKRGEHFLTVIAKISNSINGKETDLSSTQKVEVGPEANFYMDYNQYVKDGEPLVATPYFLEKRSDTRCEIKSVTYWIDDEEIDTKDTSPFALSYILPKDRNSHKMTASISYSDGTETAHLYYMTFNDIRYMEPDTHEYVVHLKGSSNFWVGDELSCVAKVYRGDNVTGTDEVKIYLDNKFLGESATFPYTQNYQLTSEDVGNHNLRLEWKNYDSEGILLQERTSYYSGIIVSE